MPFCSEDFGLHFDPSLGNSLNDIFAAFILIFSLLFLATERRRLHVRLYVGQSLFLALVALSVAFFQCERHIFIAAALTLVLKVFIIPLVMERIIHRLIPQQLVKPAINIPSSLLIGGGLVLAADLLTQSILNTGHPFALERNLLTISIAIVLLSLLTMVTRKKALTQMVGFLTMENGLFLAGITITAGMPMIVELGVLFDVMVAVFLMGFFLYKISETFDAINVEKLRKLKH